MVTPLEISGKISELTAARLSVYEFEKWFRTASRNFHRWAEGPSKDLVFEIEGVLTDLHFDGLPEEKLVAELAAAVRPFGDSCLPMDVTHVLRFRVVYASCGRDVARMIPPIKVGHNKADDPYSSDGFWTSRPTGDLIVFQAVA